MLGNYFLLLFKLKIRYYKKKSFFYYECLNMLYFLKFLDGYGRYGINFFWNGVGEF